MSGKTRATNRRLRNLGATGIAIGTLSILACELPLMLALLGLGGLSSAASIFALPPTVEMIGITTGLLGLLLLAGLLVYRVVARARS